MAKKEFNYGEFIVKYEKKIGRSLTDKELIRARSLYEKLMQEQIAKAQSLYMNQNKISLTDKQIEKKYNQLENYMLADAENLMEQHKKLAASSTIEIQQGKQRVNLKFPGKVHIIASDRSGEVIEINNKDDVEYNTMAFRYDTIKDKVKDEVNQEIRRDMEFE